jgi:hypothetical protein
MADQDVSKLSIASVTMKAGSYPASFSSKLDADHPDSWLSITTLSDIAL